MKSIWAQFQVIVMASTALLSACIFTNEPAFYSTSGLNPSESSVYLEFAGHIGLDARGTPNEEEMLVVQETPRLVIQQYNGEIEGFIYYSLQMTDGEAEVCLPMTSVESATRKVANRFGVVLAFGPKDYGSNVVPMGPKRAVQKFILAAFEELPLECSRLEVPVELDPPFVEEP